MTKPYYRILGVPTNASQADIKEAYRKLSFKHHPDKNPDGSEKAFKDILEAYTVLSNVQARIFYNKLCRCYASEERNIAKIKKLEKSKRRYQVLSIFLTLSIVSACAYLNHFNIIHLL